MQHMWSPFVACRPALDNVSRWVQCVAHATQGCTVLRGRFCSRIPQIQGHGWHALLYQDGTHLKRLCTTSTCTLFISNCNSNLNAESQVDSPSNSDHIGNGDNIHRIKPDSHGICNRHTRCALLFSQSMLSRWSGISGVPYAVLDFKLGSGFGHAGI